MTHKELRDYIDKFDAAGMVREPAVQALRTVVELHYPVSYIVNGSVQCFNDNHTYPCPTIQAIEKELA
jgi:hypothetical protein